MLTIVVTNTLRRGSEKGRARCYCFHHGAHYLSLVGVNKEMISQKHSHPAKGAGFGASFGQTAFGNVQVPCSSKNAQRAAKYLAGRVSVVFTECKIRSDCGQYHVE